MEDVSIDAPTCGSKEPADITIALGSLEMGIVRMGALAKAAKAQLD